MNRRLKKYLRTGLTWLIRLEQLAAVLLLATIVIVMSGQVIWRYGLQSPLSWSEEVARLAMIWLTFIAAGLVTAKRQHIVVDLLGEGANASTNASTDSDSTNWVSRVMRIVRSPRLAQSLVLIATLSLLFGGFRFVWRVYPVSSPSVNVSMSYWYGAATVGMILIALHTLADMLGIQPVCDKTESPDDVSPLEP